MNARPVISTVDALVAALEGPTKAATTLGERPGTITVWKHRQKIPASKYFRHVAILEERGIHASPAIWGADVPAEAP